MSSIEEKRLIASIIFLMILFFSFVASLWIIASYFEANSYRRLTGKPVTTWDAMWIDLRVQEQVRS